MKRLDIVRRSGRNLKQVKLRTFLTSSSIAVGAFTIALSLAAGEGARQFVDKLLISNIDPRSISVSRVVDIDQLLMENSDLKEYKTGSMFRGFAAPPLLDEQDIKTLQNISGVERVQPTYLLRAEYMTFTGKEQKFTASIDEYNVAILFPVAAGSLPTLGDHIGKNEAVIPESFAKTLGMSSTELIGKTVTLRLVNDANNTVTRDVPLTIRAVTTGSNTTFTTNTKLLVSDVMAKEMNNFVSEGTGTYQKYLGANVIVKEGVDPEQVKTAIEANKHMQASTAKDLSGTIFNIINILQAIVAGFGVLALLASIFGIINTQYISVLERTSQIGLMKALGMSRGDVAKLFRYEAAWIGFIGGVRGLLTAFIATIVLNPWITQALSLGEGTRLLVFVWWQGLLLIVGLTFVAIIAGWFPARKAARLDPIEALRRNE